MLAQPDFSKSFRVYTDASGAAVGAALVQGDGDQQNVIEYVSKQLNLAKRNYSVIEREALAVVWAISKFRPYIDSMHFVVHTDHRPLRWLMSLTTPSGRLARWALEVQNFSFDLEYIPGRLNALADLLSRATGYTAPVVLVQHLLLDEKPISAEEFQKLQEKDVHCQAAMISLESEHPGDRARQHVFMTRGYNLINGLLYRHLSGQ